MSDDITPLDALKLKLNAFGKEIQPMLSAAATAKVTLVVMANRINVSTEGERPVKATLAPAPTPEPPK